MVTTYYSFQFSSSWSSLAYILPILSFAIVYNIPKFFELQVKTEQLGGNGSLNNEENNDFSDTFTYEKNETMISEHFTENSSSPFHNFSLVSFLNFLLFEFPIINKLINKFAFEYGRV